MGDDKAYHSSYSSLLARTHWENEVWVALFPTTIVFSIPHESGCGGDELDAIM